MSKFEFRVMVTADTPEEESEMVKKIASEFIRAGVKSVTVIADNEHINYVDGEAFRIDNMRVMFRTDPKAPTEAFVVGHNPTLN